MHANLEYIMSGLMLLLILSVAEINLISITGHQVAKFEQKSEYLSVEKILDMLLLSPGIPLNWGNQTEEPTLLGLAEQNSIKAYMLDESKIARLTIDSPNYIPPTNSREIMDLSSFSQFNLTITPVFNINILNISSPGLAKYEITITDYKGFKTPNVNVTGFYIPTSFSNGEIYPSKSNVTGLDGSCNLTFNYTPNCSLVVYATQLNVNAIKIEPAYLGVKIVGEYMIKSNFPVIEKITYATGSNFASSPEVAIRYAEIDGITYFVRFELQR